MIIANSLRIPLFAIIFLSQGVTANANVTQVMGVPKGSVVKFGSDRIKLVPAFCLEGKVNRAPYRFTELNNVVGRVKVVFGGDKPPIELELNEALSKKWIRFTGADYAHNGTSISIEALDVSVTTIEFLTHAAFGDGHLASRLSEDDLGNAILSPLDSFDLHKYHEAVREGDTKTIDQMQNDLWNFEVPFSLRKSKGELVSHRAPTKGASTVKMYGLATQADCCLIHTASGKCILHDIGTSSEETLQVVQDIQLQRNHKKVISVFITHAHLDHYKGLEELLGNPDVLIEQFIIGYPKSRSARKEQPVGAFEKVLKTIYDAGYSIPENCPESITQFIKDDTTPSLKVSFLKRPGAGVIGLINETAAASSYRILFPLSAAKPNSKNKHDFNLVTTYECRQTRILDFGDADPPQIRDVLNMHLEALAAVTSVNTKYPAAYKLRCNELLHAGLPDRDDKSRRVEELRAKTPVNYSEVISHQLMEIDVLKWPHHAWRPNDMATRDLMKRLIKSLRPKEIVISAKIDEASSSVLDRISDIDEIVKEACREETVAGRALSIDIRRATVEYIVWRGWLDFDPMITKRVQISKSPF